MKVKDRFLEDLDWAETHHSELLDKYREQWVAVYNKQVVSHGDSLAQVRRVLHDAELEKKGIEVIRLLTRIQFKTAQRWSDKYSAIVDTGAYVSLIPLSVWQERVAPELLENKQIQKAFLGEA